MAYILNKNNLKLLYELDKDCKQSNRNIAKKLNISKDSVGYRIKQLEKNNIIRGYRAIINTSKLGFIVYRIFFNFINLSKQKRKEMISFLYNSKNVWWIAENDGSWKFVFAMITKHPDDFYNFYIKEFAPKYNKYIKQKLICPIVDYTLFSRSYFIDSSYKTSFKSLGGRKIKDYDEIDISILKILSINSRLSFLEISKKLNLDSKTIRTRIKKLENNKIIEGYRADIDINKLNKDFYSIGIILNNFVSLDEIKKYVSKIPETISTSQVIGGDDFRFDVDVNDSKRYFEIIEELKKEFPNIRETNYYRILQNYKIISFPSF